MRKHLSPMAALFIVSLMFTSPKAIGQGIRNTLVSTGESANGDGSFTVLQDALLNDSGEVGFFSSLAGTSNGSDNDTAIYLYSTGGLLELFRESDTAPDLNGNLAGLSIVNLNENGFVLTRGFFSNTNGGVNDDSGMLIGTRNGDVFFAAREGSPSFGGNGEFSGFNPTGSNYGFNKFGNVSFRNVSRNTAGGSSDDDGVFSSFGRVVREGGADGFTSFGATAKINDTGEVAFTGNVGSDIGIYLLDGSSNAQLYYAEGANAPDFNGTLSFVQSFLAVNESGQIAFEASFTDTANDFLDNEAILRSDGSSTIQIYREGNPVPGGDGNFLNSLSSTIRLNQSGQVAFTSALRETSLGTSNDSAIYRSSSSGFALTEMAREGDQIDSGNGMLGSISTTSISMNEKGHVAFLAFLEGTADDFAVFISDGEELITVVQRGEAMDGSSVLSLDFQAGDKGATGLNNQGKIVYVARLADSRYLLQEWTPELHWRRTFSSDWDVSSYWTLGIEPGPAYDVFIDPPGTLEVEGPSQDTTVNRLTIGGGTGFATFEMESGAILTVDHPVVVESTGIVTGNGTLNCDVTNHGTVLARDVNVSGFITNEGVITGTGRITSEIMNDTSGDIRVESGQDLELLGGLLENSGLVDVVDGTLEVEQLATNMPGSLIFASDAFFRFNSGLENGGGLGVTVGNSYIYGDVNNQGTGVVNVSGGASLTFVDDFVQNGAFQVVSVGNTFSSAVLFGEFGGAGGFTGGGDVFALGDLRPGNSPASVLMDGNLFLGGLTTTEIEIGGTAIGEFDQLVVTGELSLAGNLEVVFIDGFVPATGDEFVIAEVGGDSMGEFQGLPDGAQVGSTGMYIYYDGGDGNDIVLSTVGPQTIVTPETLIVTRGDFINGDEVALSTSDNVDLTIRRRISDIQSRTEFEVKSTSPTSSPTSMRVTLEGAVFARSAVTQQIQLFDYELGVWELVDSRSASRFSDRTHEIEIAGDLSRFVEAGTNCIRARILNRSLNPRQQFTSNTDLFQWTIGE